MILLHNHILALEGLSRRHSVHEHEDLIPTAARLRQVEATLHHAQLEELAATASIPLLASRNPT